MKKRIALFFILIAGVSCLQGISFFMNTFEDDQTCYIVDSTQEESTEKSEKEGKSKETDSEEQPFHFDDHLTVLVYLSENAFHLDKEKVNYPPYFEIYSPPPELT